MGRGLADQACIYCLQRTTKSHRRDFSTTKSQRCSLGSTESIKSYLTTSDARGMAVFAVLTLGIDQGEEIWQQSSGERTEVLVHMKEERKRGMGIKEGGRKRG